MRKMSKRLSGILRSISTNPLLLNAGCKETNKIIKKGEGNPQNQESAVAKLLIDNGFKFIEKNKKENGNNKTTDRILTLFLIEYYKKTT